MSLQIPSLLKRIWVRGAEHPGFWPTLCVCGAIILVFGILTVHNQVRRFSLSGVKIGRTLGINSANISPVEQAPIKEPVPELQVDTKTGLTSYVSQSGKFQVEYPSDLKIHVNYVHVQGTQVYHPVANVIELDSPSLGKAPYVLIAYGENLTTSTVHDYVENSTECEAIENNPGVKVFVGGVPGLLYKNVSCSDKPETRVYFIKDKMEYTITISGNPVDEHFLTDLLAHFSFVP